MLVHRIFFYILHNFLTFWGFRPGQLLLLLLLQILVLTFYYILTALLLARQPCCYIDDWVSLGLSDLILRCLCLILLLIYGRLLLFHADFRYLYLTVQWIYLLLARS